MICGQVREVLDLSNVPLSCVPPCRCAALSAATDRLWNCKVESPVFKLWRKVGTLESNWSQRAKSVPLSPRGVAHWDEMSAKLPLDRMSPPSEPSKKRAGLVGLTTSACWSG